MRVSELCFGTMTFGGDGMYKAIGATEQAEADRLVGACLEAGINFFDTADVYSGGDAETILGKALGARRKEVVLATKVRGRVGPGPNAVGLSRGHILDGVEASLKRLGTDYIDLYQIHGYDAVTPSEETLRALDDLVRSGKVRYLGASNLAAWQLMKALGISQRDGLARFETIQSYYSIAGRDLERELVPLMDSEGVGLLVWSPLAGGFLSGKFSRDKNRPDDTRRASFNFPPVDETRGYAVLDVLAEVAREHGVSVARVALGMAAAPAGHHLGDHRRPQRDPAARQPGRRRGQALARAARAPRPGERAAARIPGVDDPGAGARPAASDLASRLVRRREEGVVAAARDG